MDSMIAEFLTLLCMAFALGMDSFSVGLGMGMYKLRKRQILLISGTVGAFHVIMPLLGIMLGQFLSARMGVFAAIAGGLLLILLGAGMFLAGLKGKSEPFIAPVGYGLLLFATSVSLDSLSVGLSLGIYGARTALVVSLFGMAATILTLSGLLAGRRVRGVLGAYSQLFGGSILFAFGVKLLLPI